MEHIDFEAYLQETTQEIIIFGAGEMSRYLYDTCVKSGITVTAFCDNDATKWGKELHGLLINSLTNIQQMYKNPLFLVSVIKTEHQESIAQQLDSVGCTEHYSLLHCIEHMNFTKIDDVCIDIGVMQTQKIKYEVADSPVLYAHLISFSITEKCTLRCRDCAAFIPYHEVQEHRTKEAIFQQLDTINDLFDDVDYIIISGGEALMHPDVYEILAYAQTKSTFKYVFLYTNGTILPKKEELMKLDTTRLGVVCSDYGDLSIKRTELIQLLDELKIKYDNAYETEWLDCTSLDFRNKSIPELLTTYEECWNNCIVVVEGKLFRCSQTVSAYLLKSIPSHAVRYVDCYDTSKTKVELQQELKQYLYGTKYLEACNWCTGKTKVERIVIPKAVQTTELLPYKKYLD